MIELQEYDCLESWKCGGPGKPICQFGHVFEAVRWFYRKLVVRYSVNRKEPSPCYAICFLDKNGPKCYHFVFSGRDIHDSFIFGAATATPHDFLPHELRKGIMVSAGISIRDPGIVTGITCGTIDDLLKVCELYHEAREEGREVDFQTLQREVGLLDLGYDP